MKKSFTITIPEPCHEDWGKMTPTEKGKFCDQCAKEVFDFTETADEEIVKKLSAGDNLCGRFKNTQLNREMKLERKSNNSLLPYAASLLLPLSILGHQEAHSQGGTTAFHKPAISLNIGSHSSAEKSIVTITGQISDSEGKPIKNAEVIVLETGNTFFSDTHGNYSLACASGSTIIFQKDNLAPQEIVIGNKNDIINVLLQNDLMPIPHILGKFIEMPDPVIQNEKETSRNLKDSLQNNEEVKSITISGTITDESNLPLPGVNVMIKETKSGTYTDFDGNYSLEVEPNMSLEFSYLSYKNKEVTLSNISNEVSFAMQPDESIMGDIVVGGAFAHVSDINFTVNTNPYARESYLDSEQKNNRHNRQEHAAKENAFKKVKMAREKAARKLKRALKKKK